MTSGASGYDVSPLRQDGGIDLRAQKTGLMRLDDAIEAARVLSGNLRHGRLTYQKVQVKDAGTGRIAAEFAHGDRLHDHRSPRDEVMAASEAMRDAGFPSQLAASLTPWRTAAHTGGPSTGRCSPAFQVVTVPQLLAWKRPATPSLDPAYPLATRAPRVAIQETL